MDKSCLLDVAQLAWSLCGYTFPVPELACPARPEGMMEDMPKVVMCGSPRCGKTSISKVVFQKLSPHESMFLENGLTRMETFSVCHNHLLRLRLVDFPGAILCDENVSLHQNDAAIFGGGDCVVVLVIDAQEESYATSISRAKKVIEFALKRNSKLTFDVLIHKVDGAKFYSEDRGYQLPLRIGSGAAKLRGLMADVPVPRSAGSSTPEDCDPREERQRRDAQPRWVEKGRPRRDPDDRQSRDERRSRGRGREPERHGRREDEPHERRERSGETGKGSKGGKKGKGKPKEWKPKGKGKGKSKEKMFSRAEVQSIVAEALDQADARRAMAAAQSYQPMPGYYFDDNRYRYWDGSRWTHDWDGESFGYASAQSYGSTPRSAAAAAQPQSAYGSQWSSDAAASHRESKETTEKRKGRKKSGEKASRPKKEQMRTKQEPSEQKFPESASKPASKSAPRRLPQPVKKPTEPPQKKSKAAPQVKPGGDDDPSSDYTPMSTTRNQRSLRGMKEIRKKRLAPMTLRCDRQEEQGDRDRRRRREAPGGGGPGGGDGDGSGTPDESSDLASTARTSEIKAILKAQVEQRSGDRARPNLGQVRIEPFRGSREAYKEWKRTVEAQQALYKLDEPEMSMMIYLSCHGEARQVLNVLTVDEMLEAGGLNRVLRLLEESFGVRSDERFEQRQEAYLSYRRQPGVSIAEYVSTLKRLRAEYLAEDPGTTISDKAFAQRLLSRASLTRKERMDIFFSSGGAYRSGEIEKVMRFRCSNIHLDERKTSGHHDRSRASDDRGNYKKKAYTKNPPRRGDRRPARASHHANVAEPVEPNDQDEPYDYEEDEEDEDDEETAGIEDLKDAYAAGWKAKQKTTDVRKARGYHQTGKGKGKERRSSSQKTPEQRKRTSKCSSCGQIGHWHGDAVCPNVKSGKDPPRQPKDTSGTYHASTLEAPSSRASASASARSDGSGSVKVSKVNWSFPVTSTDGWDLLQEYSSEESEEDQANAFQLRPFASAAPRTEGRTPKKESTYKVRLKTVLDALIEQLDDEEIQDRLRRKELRSAPREEPQRSSKRHDAGRRPMEMDLKPAELLALLPSMSTQEKKDLYRTLKKQLEEEQALPPEDPGMMVRPSQRRDGYTHSSPKIKCKAAPPAPSVASSSSVAAPPTSESGKMPEPVRKKKMQEFRRKLYENALDRKGRVRPSEASDLPTTEQEMCPHDWDDLRWGGNGGAHWATCKRCGMRKVLYYSMEHGALATAAKTAVLAEPIWYLEGGECQIILDTGCRTAVAGSAWHLAFQKRLAEHQLRWYEVEHQEVFRFGAGEPVLSTKAYIYPVTLGETGVCSWLRLAMVGNTIHDHRVEHCPALVGPSEMRRWDTKMDFGTGHISLAGHEMPLRLSETRHPVISVMDERQTSRCWETPELEKLREVLINDPYSLALLQETVEHESDSQGEDATHHKKCCSSEEESEELEELTLWQEQLEDEAIRTLDEIEGLHQMFQEGPTPNSEDEDSQGSISVAESETTHDGGPELEDLSTSSESDYGEVLHADVPGEPEQLNKGQRRRLLDAVQKVALTAEDEVREKKELKRSRVRPRKPGPWRIIEICTWTCALTMTAFAQGWEAFEPITLESGWDLEKPEVQQNAMNYLDQIDPDVVMIAWPCGPWSALQNLNQGTPLRRRLLRRKRLRSRKTLLAFTRRAALWQRQRGRIVLGENPYNSGAWKTPEIEEAFSGLGEVDFDQCMTGLRHPVNKMHMKKRTKFRGPHRALKYLKKCQCRGRHKHHPIEGGFKTKEGRWMRLSECAGGYGKRLCKAILKGVTECLEEKNEVHAVDTDEETEEAPEIVDGHEDIEEALERELEKEERDRGEVDDAAEERLEEDQRHPVPKEVQRAVQFAHRQLGHPSRSSLVRMLKLSGATQEAIRYAQQWSCEVCAARRPPKHPQAATVNSRPYGFNHTLHVDLKYLWDCREKKYVCMSVLCLGTGLHQAQLLKTRRSDYVASKFLKHWIQPFGAPRKLVHDQGGEFEAAFVGLMEQFSINTTVTGAHAPWQLGVGERHGSLLGHALQSIVTEQQCEGYRSMKEALSCACMAKNATVTRDGFTPNQRVYGSECAWPSMADEEPGLSFVEALDANTQAARARAHRMRMIARVALIRSDIREKMRRTLLRKPHTSQGPFVPGVQVYFWVPTLNRARYRPGGQWRGPATVLVKEQQKRYFVSWRGRLLLLAEENLRLATKEELTLTEPIREEMVDLQGVLRDPMRSNTYEDMRNVRPPPARPRRKRAAPAAEEDPERKRARQMLRGSKSTNRLMAQAGMLPARRRKAPPRRKAAEPAGKRQKTAAAPTAEERGAPVPEAVPEKPPGTSIQAAPGTPDSVVPSPESPIATPTGEEAEAREEAPASAERIPDEELPPVPDDTEPWTPDGDPPEELEESIEQAVRQEWQHMDPDTRRQNLMDDVPLTLKRKMEAQGGGMPSKRARVNASWVVQALAGVTGGGPNNEWVSRYELETLKKLTGLPLTAARIHRKPRKKFQKPPKLVSRARVSILIGEDPQDTYVVEETEEEVKKNPRRKAPMTWTGMTLFLRRPAKQEIHHTDVEMPGGIYEARQTEEQRREFETLWLEEIKDHLVTEVMLLKMKQSGKELDPKYFDEKERAEFLKSDTKEWSQWIEHGVIRRVPEEEAKKIPRWQIFKAPLRMVRTNKAGSPLEPLVAKSRLVVPGHRDPELGEFRTDAPTTSGVATRVAKCIAQGRGWSVWAFDVSTAFLSGDATQRQIFVRAPEEGLPAAAGEIAVPGGELFQILKSAYGLTEAPRLWYLKASRDIATTPLVELPIAKATYAAADEKGTWALLNLHVDDGLLMGSDSDPRFVALRRRFDELFNIKSWKQIPMTFLGVDLARENDLLVDTMESYIENIQIPELEAKDPEAALVGRDLTCYRQLIMRLRWPAAQTMPQLLYETSSLAQRVSQATVKDFKDAVKLHSKMKEEAQQGRARLRYPKIKGELALVTFFDASLGKEKDGKSQLGHIHFLTTKGVENGPQPAAVIDFGTSRSGRVVRSSMAAESNSMSIATDRHLYNRLLVDMLQFGVKKVTPEWRRELRIPGYVVTDAKSLFDHLGSTGQVPTERQTMLDLMVCREQIEQGAYILKWVPTHRQYADGLTKAMKNLLWEAFSKSKVECQTIIHDKLTEELADKVQECSINFHCTSIYDHSIFEAFSKIVQKLIPEKVLLEQCLQSLLDSTRMEKVYLFDVVSKLYLASDRQPVDLQWYELCADMVDLVIDIACIYGNGSRLIS
eukprot:s641_g4.t1